MSVKFNDHSANERRRNAEVSYKDILTRRLGELNVAADAVQATTLRAFPYLFAPSAPVVKPVESVVKAPVALTEPATNGPAPAVTEINQVSSEQDKRIMAARQATEDAQYEASA